MKKQIFLAALAALVASSVSQAQGVMVIKMNDEAIYELRLEDITQVAFSVNEEIVDAPPAFLRCPDGNHPHLIDLGLPSGTKWACCNVGASLPEQYGNYYAWGETETKDTYNDDTYSYYSDNLGEDIAGTQYDVAHVKWGSSWRIPTYTQILELVTYCTRSKTYLNGRAGTLVTGPNGSTIFLPFAGLQMGNTTRYKAERGCYWSSTPKDAIYAHYLSIRPADWNRYYSIQRSEGLTVRPVSR